MDKKATVFAAYKTLRNHLRKLSLVDSMEVIWAYNRKIDFPKKEIPAHIEHNNNSLHISCINGWRLENLMLETIINAQEGQKSLKSYSYMAAIINNITALEGAIGGCYITTENVLVEVFRMTHQQFSWQRSVLHTQMSRYYQIFSAEQIPELVIKKFQLSLEQIFYIGMLLLGGFLDRPFLKISDQKDVGKVSIQNIQDFIQLFSIDIEQIKKTLTENFKLDETYQYNFSPLTSFPLIRFKRANEEYLACPSIKLLFWRITSGLYFDLFHLDPVLFGKALGNSFESYVGTTLKKIFIATTDIIILPEEKYLDDKKNEVKSVDWILHQENFALFLECKSKRVKLNMKISLTRQDCEEECKSLAKIILQTYKQIKSYRSNLYPHFPYDQNTTVIPVIVTLENWYFLHPMLVKEVEDFLKLAMVEEDIPLDWLNSIPYQICSVDELENASEVIKTIGLGPFIKNKLAQTNKQSSWQNFISIEYPHIEIDRTLHADVYNSIFD